VTWALVTLALAAAPWSQQSDADRAGAMQKLKGKPLAERLISISDGFLGTPYKLSPLGEGEGVDPDPLIRFDLVDCLTMVEETMAMAMAPSADQLVPTLNGIRYAGAPVFEARNHLMEAQWLPDNLKKGRLKDISQSLSPHTVVIEKVLDAKAWSGNEGKALNLPESARLKGSYPVRIIPVDEAQEALAKAPTGSLVVVVRKDRPTAVTRVTHVGFLVQKKSGPFLRHASKTFKKAVDEELSKYVGRNLGYAKWTVEGFAVYEVTEPKSTGT
jgi:hypothetical protein